MNFNNLEITLNDKNNIDFGMELLKINDILCQRLGKRVLDKAINKIVNSLDKNNCIENYRETILPINYVNIRLSSLNLNRVCENIKL